MSCLKALLVLSGFKALPKPLSAFTAPLLPLFKVFRAFEKTSWRERDYWYNYNRNRLKHQEPKIRQQSLGVKIRWCPHPSSSSNSSHPRPTRKSQSECWRPKACWQRIGTCIGRKNVLIFIWETIFNLPFKLRWHVETLNHTLPMEIQNETAPLKTVGQLKKKKS